MGEIVGSEQARVRVKMYSLMDSEVLQRYSISPISPNNFPVAYYNRIVEVYKMADEIFVSRSNIIDFVFVLPMAEVESGMLSMSGADNVYCMRFYIANSSLHECNPNFYFCRYVMEPFSVRMFTTLNTLSQNVRRLMYHQSESATSKCSFRLALFPMEAFWYLAYKIGGVGVGACTVKSQSVTKYFNTLRMECCSKRNTLSYIRIMSRSALTATRKVLGHGVGVGLAKKRPTKAMPTDCCTIGCMLTSIDCSDEIPYEVLLKPDAPCTANGIDFVYSEQNRYLSCTVRFTKVTVSTADVATCRISSADVGASPESGVYVSVWFKYNNALLEVVAINGETVLCTYVEEAEDDIELPMQLVAQLVAQFGTE